MADSKVSELASATSAGGSDVLYLVQSNTSKKITIANLFGDISNPTLTGNVVVGGTPQTLSAPGIISITTPITHLSVDGVGGTLQIPQGSSGQIKVLTMTASQGGTYTLSTSNVAGNVSLSFNSIGDTAVLVFTNGKWFPVDSTSGISLTNISSNVIPSANSVYDLGSATNQWKSLYVSNNTIYIGGTPVTVVNGELVVGSGEASANLATVAYVDGAVANAGGGGSANTGNITFTNTIISAPDSESMTLQVRDGDEFVRSSLSLASSQGRTRLSSLSTELDQSYNAGDWSSATWTGNDVSFVNAPGIVAFIDTGSYSGALSRTFSINGGPRIEYDGANYEGNNITFFSAVAADPDPTTVTTMEFFYQTRSQIYMDHDNEELLIQARDYMDILITGDEDINIEAGRNMYLESVDFEINCSDDLTIEASDRFSLRNRSISRPIVIETDYDGEDHTWEFGADGTLTTAGDIIVSGDVSGTSVSSTLSLSAQPNSNTFIQLNNAVDSSIRTQANLEIRTNGVDNPSVWNFDTDGVLSAPGDIAANSYSLNTSASISVEPGQMAWNNSDGTLDVGTGYGGVVLQVGQETHYVVRNSSGDQIENGTAVYCNGVTEGAGRKTVLPMVGDGSISPVDFLGLATMDINNGVNGVITYFGYVRGLDTRGTANTAISVGDETWAVGDNLYVHPTAPGKLTKFEPEAPNTKICVGAITTRNQTTGIIFVRPTTNLVLNKLSDVQVDTPLDGQLLQYVSANTRWEATSNVVLNTLNVTSVSSNTTANLSADGFKAIFYNPITGQFAYSTD